MTSDSQQNYFRQDIQGLRGLAVLLVVIYHSGIGLPGGFIGVDMFFVISGFVITQILIRELKLTGTISFKEFYSRRARRLLPALALVTVVTLGLSVFVISPFGGQQEVAKTAQATSLFYANAYMFLENTYFSLAMNPFRHMWSLAIEEQFYFLLPISLLAAWKLVSRFSERSQQVLLGSAVAVISILSFVFGALLSFGYRLTPLPERFAFFGTPSRIWEFGVGVLLAIIPLNGKIFKKLASAIFIFSVVAIVWSVTQLSSYTAFPGYVALAPVLGTGGLIVAGHNSERLRQLMSIRPLARLGDLSYGWYLWHWPFTVFSLTLWPTNAPIALLAGFVSLAPTIISYNWFEQPIRRNQNITGVRVLRLAALCIIIPLLSSVLVERLANTELGLTQPEVKALVGAADDCGFTAQSDQWTQEQCTFRVEDSKGTIFLFGDSQARAFADGVIKSGNELGYDVSVLATAGCPMAARAPLGVSWCEDIQSRLIELVEGCEYRDGMDWRSSWCEGDRVSKPSLVIFGNSATRYMGDEYLLPDGDGRLPKEFKNRTVSVVSATTEAVQLVQNQKVPVLLIYEAPSVTIDLGISIIRPNPRIESRKYSDQMRRNAVLALLDLELAGLNSVSTFDPADLICINDLCRPIIDERIIYSDPSHLNVVGSEFLSSALTQKIKALLG